MDKLKLFCKRVITRVINFFIKLYIRFKGNALFLKRAIREADRLHKQNGKRYRVFFFGYRYYAWDRQEIKRRKQIGLFKRDKKVGEDFDKICFYDTNPESYVSDK